MNDIQGATEYRRQYKYDKSGNRTELKRQTGTSPIVTETYLYDGFAQCATVTWTESGTDYMLRYGYDLNGNLRWKQELYGSPLVQSSTWTYEWDKRKQLSAVSYFVGSASNEIQISEVEFKYCPMCGGSITERIEKDENGLIVSWLRYESDAGNLLRIDERYDTTTDGNSLIDSLDPWRPLNSFIHRPGFSGTIIRDKSYDYSGPVPVVDERYMMYDGSGNVVGVFLTQNSFELYHMDYFGNPLPNEAWPSIKSKNTKQKYAGQVYDEILGLYIMKGGWYDPRLGRFINRYSPLEEGISQHVYIFPSPLSILGTGGIGKLIIPSNCDQKDLDCHILRCDDATMKLLQATVGKTTTTYKVDAVYTSSDIKRTHWADCTVTCTPNAGNSTGPFTGINCIGWGYALPPPYRPASGFPDNPLTTAVENKDCVTRVCEDGRCVTRTIPCDDLYFGSRFKTFY